MPRLWIAGARAATSWRRANVLLTAEDDTDFLNVVQLDGGTVIGSALTVLPAGPSWCWDRFSHVDIEVLEDRDWLEYRSAAAGLGGANLALLGDELVQFAHAEALAPRRFRLSGLLRGRRGTEAAVAQHGSGERFILIDRAGMLTVDLPLDRLDSGGLAKPAGAGDAETKPTPFVLTGNALRPLAPVHLRLQRYGGDIALSLLRRSRAGFGRLDFVDVPLGEEREIYRVEVRLDGQSVRQADVEDASFVYTAAQRAADGNGAILEFAVAQLGTAIGPGDAATIRATI